MARNVSSGKDAAANIAKVLRAGRAGIVRDLDRLGMKLVNELREDLSRPGTGRLYTTTFWTDRQGRLRRGGPRVPHRASAPGEPPAVDTGRYRASWTHEAERTRPGVDTLTVATADEKAKFLEFGTINMKPRPVIRPLMARSHDTVQEAVRDGIEGREKAMARRIGGEG